MGEAEAAAAGGGKRYSPEGERLGKINVPSELVEKWQKTKVRDQPVNVKRTSVLVGN